MLYRIKVNNSSIKERLIKFKSRINSTWNLVWIFGIIVLIATIFLGRNDSGSEFENRGDYKYCYSKRDERINPTQIIKNISDQELYFNFIHEVRSNPIAFHPNIKMEVIPIDTKAIIINQENDSLLNIKFQIFRNGLEYIDKGYISTEFLHTHPSTIY